MTEYTLSLALVDFLPVLFTAIGLTSIARMVTHISREHGQVAVVGAILTVTGGFLKALWKLLMAASGGTINLRWMDDGLFVWMAPGYALLFWSVWQIVRGATGKPMRHASLVPVVFIILMFASSAYLYFANPDSPAWERVLLSVMVLATFATGILLIVFGFRQKLPLVGWLFIVNLVGIFLLNGLARMDEQTITLQWIEESINTVSWLCFALAARKLLAHTRLNFGVQ